MKKKPKNYIVVYQNETDGDIHIHKLNAMQILKLSKSIDQREITIIDGELIKTFNTLINVEKL